ncbi:MAG: zinc-ribbon domain-containing protein [Candidatus Lokiarchaeota archaeon]|nr:zinc-ribbon domain-containing protein [Candidatus Lokiarchaeota archaeon]
MVKAEHIDASEPIDLKRFYRKFLKIITFVIVSTIKITAVILILIANYFNYHDPVNTVISVVTPMIIVATMPYIVIILAYFDEKRRLEKNPKFKCPQCGNQNRSKAKFCENCGKKISFVEESDT